MRRITITFFALFGSLFLMTQYWQFVLGYTPCRPAFGCSPTRCVMMVAPLSARLVEQLGTKRVVTTGLLLIAPALVLLSTIHARRYPMVITSSASCRSVWA